PSADPRVATPRAAKARALRAFAEGDWGPGTAKSSLVRSLRLERSHVYDKAIFHVALQQALVGGVDLLHWDKFDVRSDALLSAEIEHFLSFPDTANDGPGKPAALYQQR